METAVITGANRGIGLELTKLLRARGADVIAGCRRSSPELQKTGARIESGLEVTSAASVAEFAARIDKKVSLLINNAGILRRETLEEMDFDAIQKQIEVNAIGPLRVTHALLPKLDAGSKIALVTSRMGSIADNTSGARYGYRMSKAALNMAGVSLAHDLKPRRIAVAILHPGWVQTEMTGHTGNVTADQSARQLLERIDRLSLDTSGTFFHANGEVLPW